MITLEYCPRCGHKTDKKFDFLNFVPPLEDPNFRRKNLCDKFFLINFILALFCRYPFIIMPNKVCAIPAIPTKESSTKNLHHNEGVIRRIFNGHFRFVMLALSTVCLTLGMCKARALHFTVICRPKNGTDTTAKGWATTNKKRFF